MSTSIRYQAIHPNLGLYRELIADIRIYRMFFLLFFHDSRPLVLDELGSDDLAERMTAIARDRLFANDAAQVSETYERLYNIIKKDISKFKGITERCLTLPDIYDELVEAFGAGGMSSNDKRFIKKIAYGETSLLPTGGGTMISAFSVVEPPSIRKFDHLLNGIDKYVVEDYLKIYIDDIKKLIKDAFRKKEALLVSLR